MNFNTFRIVINPELKNFISIFLLVCFAIYHFGYYAFYFSYDQHLENTWKEIIFSENSLEAEEKLIEVPLSMPYMANQEEFHPTNTPYENDGKYYRIIKQRYQNDTLQLIVMPDAGRRVLDNTVKKWVSLLVGDEFPQDQKNSITLKFFVKDYLQPNPFLFKAYSQSTIDFSVCGLFFQHVNPIVGTDTPPPQFS